MLKNRDTPSNPYRVPPQPTPVWIKVCITCLFLLVGALIGAVVYLMISPPKCTCDIDIPMPSEAGNRKFVTSRKKVAMADDSSDNTARQESNVRNLVNRVNRLSEAVSRIQTMVSDLQSSTRVSKSRVIEDPPTGSANGVTLSPSDVAMLQKVPKIEALARGLDNKLTRHINTAQEVCKDGHYRLGVYCYVIGEAALTQRDAKNWCQTDYGVHSTLAVIKNRFIQDFLVSKLPNRLHSYWIGVERQSPVPAGFSDYGTPGPLAPLPVKSTQFEYFDGTRVQKNVFQMWRPRNSADADNNGDPVKNCAALSFDRFTSQWRWDEKECLSRYGYICQYFILA